MNDLLPNGDLSMDQAKALSLLILGTSPRKIAKSLGIQYADLIRWFSIPAFRDKMRKAADDIAEDTAITMKMASRRAIERAIDKLSKHLEDPDPRVSIRACQVLMTMPRLIVKQNYAYAQKKLDYDLTKLTQEQLLEWAKISLQTIRKENETEVLPALTVKVEEPDQLERSSNTGETNENGSSNP